MDYSQFLMMPQELGLIVVFLLVFLFDTFAPTKGGLQKSPKWLPTFTALVFGVYTVLSFFVTVTGTAFGGMFEATVSTSLMKSILNIGMLIVLIQSIKWAGSEFIAVRRGEFYELILTTLFGMYLMISARHFLVFVIGLETASLPLAALVAFNKNRYESHEAAAKYLFTAIFSSAILLLGLSFVYGISGSMYFTDIAGKIGSGRSALLITAIAFVIAGIGFKLSLVPFHLWTADVYQGAPTVVTSYLSVISKGAAAYAFLIILVQVFGSVYSVAWEWMLYALIVLTITLGNLFALRQRNIKRFLAFSSISQAGYIMLGVVASNSLGMGALMFYVLVYIVSNLGAFGVVAAIERVSGRVSIDDYNGLYRTNPKLSVAMMLAMFSLAGIPPFAGFFSKFFIFMGAIETGSVAIYILVLIALINTIPSLYYYLLVVKAMFIRQDECAIQPFKSAASEKIAILVCTLAICLIGIVSCIYNGILGSVEASNIFY